MSEKPNKEDTKRRLDWHSGFEGGLMLSFRKYAKDIEIEREHPLSKEPLRVDFLVIKKRHDVVIDNAVLEISARANRNLYDKLKGEDTVEALKELMADELKEAGDKARKETEEKYSKVIAEKDETIANLMAEITRLKENK
ncbi:MAG: hypothetical protein J6M44_00915 [Butyrivibrio sp.]|nr:hypothetical protein [Butyrivibrio sp.]